MHAPSLKELMQQNAMGGLDWRDQFAFGFPTLGEFGDPGVSSLRSDFSGMRAREDPPNQPPRDLSQLRKGRNPKRKSYGAKLYPRLRKAGSTDLAVTVPPESCG